MTQDGQSRPPGSPSHGRSSSSGKEPQDARDQSGGAARSRGRRRGGKGRQKRVDGKPIDVPPVTDELRRRIGQTLDEGEYIVFDIETTGGNPEKNGITEIFAVRYLAGEPRDTFYSLVNPGIPIPPIVRRMTGIDNKMVRDAPRIGDVMPDFVKFAGDAVLVSHNTIGDIKFLRYFAKTAADATMDNFFLCTHLLVEKLAPEAPDKSLKGLGDFFKLSRGELHRAEGDAWLTLELFKVLLGRLKARSVRTIDEGVRLQGDLESGTRLGWGVSPEVLARLPSSPGVFFLKDHEKKTLFLSCAHNIEREVQKLRAHGQVPRQLVKLIFRAYDIGYETTPDIFSAMLAECDALATHKVTFTPVNWHQRNLQTIFVARAAGALKVGIGPLEADTIHAFGPVRDRRVAGEFVDALAKACGARMTRDGFILEADAATVATAEKRVVDLLSGNLALARHALAKRAKALKLLFKPAERRALKAELAIVDALIALKAPPRLLPLLDQSGLMLLPAPDDEREGRNRQSAETAPADGDGTKPRQPLPITSWLVHALGASRWLGVSKLKGEFDGKAAQKSLEKIGEQISADLASVAAMPLSERDALRSNAVLWCLYGGGGRDMRFLPLSQLLPGAAPLP